MADQVGQGFLAIMPSFRGFRKSVDNEMGGAAKSGAASLKRGFGRTAADLGRAQGKGFKGAFQSASKGLGTGSANALKNEYASATRALSAARLKQQDSAGKVRVAEAQLADAMKKHGAGSVQVIRAEERLASVQRSNTQSTEQTKAASDRLSAAKKNLAAAQNTATSSTNRLRASLSATGKGLRSAAGFAGRAAKTIGTGLSTAAKGAAVGLAAVAGGGVRAFTNLLSAIIPLQRIIGGTTKEVSGLRGAMQLSGMDTDKANMSLTIFAKKLTAAKGSSEAMAKLQDQLGFSVTTADGKLQSMGKILPKVADRFAGMKDGAEKTALATTLFGRSGTAMLPFLNKGSAGIAELTKKAQVLGLVVSDTDKEKFGAFRGSVRTLGAMFQGLSVKVGSTILPVLTGLATAAQNVLMPAFERMHAWLSRLAPIFDGLGAKLSAAGGGLQGIRDVLSSLNPTAVVAGGAFAALASGGIVGLLSRVPLLGGALAGLLGPLKLLTGPLGIAAMALGAFALSGGDATKLGESLTATISNIAGQLPSMVQSIVGGLQTIVPQLVQAFVDLAPVLVQALLQLVQALIPALIGMIPQLITAAQQLVTGLVEGLTTALPMLIEGGIQLLLGLVQAVSAALPQIISALLQLIPQLITALVSALPMLIEGGLQLFLGIIQALVQAIPQIVTALVEAIPLIIEALVSALPQLIEGAIQLFLGVIDGLGQAIPQVITALIEALPRVIEALVSALPQLIEGAITLFLGVVTGLVKAIPKIIEAVIAMIPKIIKALIEATPQLVQAGLDLVRGLVEGIMNAGQMVIDAIGKLIGNAIDWAKEMLGIRSPSRVFKSIGSFLTQGLAIGVLSSSSKVKTAVGRLVQMTKDAFSKLDDERTKSKKRIQSLEDRIDKTKDDKLKNRLRSELVAEKKNFREINALRAKGSKSILARIASDQKKLEKNARAREQVAAKLKAATKSLEDAIKVRADWAASVQTAITGLGDIGGRGSAGSMISNLQKQIQNTASFQAKLKTLIGQGLDKESVRQLTEDFLQSGSLKGVNALERGGADAVKQIAELQKQLAAQAAKLGAYTGDHFYKAGIDAQQGIVNGLTADLKKLEKAGEKLGKALVTAVKKYLRIKSPSRLLRDEVGKMLPRGVAAGIEDPTEVARLKRAAMSLVQVPQVSLATAGGVPAGASSAQPVVVSLEGAIIRADMDGTPIDLRIQKQLVAGSLAGQRSAFRARGGSR